jgi:membrane protease YdiL (CAAX protease family)
VLVELVIAILGTSFVLGAIAGRIWPSDSRGWKAFSSAYGFLPAIIAVGYTALRTGTLSFGELSFTTVEAWAIIVAAAIPPCLFFVSLAVQLRLGAVGVKEGTRVRQLLPGLLIAAVVLVPLVAGEEIAWRGYLQGPLTRELGTIAGVVVLGLVWGIWHAPIALRGHNLRSMFWAEAFVLYPVMCVAYSFPMAFLTLETGSIWPALVFHGVNNAVGSVGGSVLEQRMPGRQVGGLAVIGAGLALVFGTLLLAS